MNYLAILFPAVGRWRLPLSRDQLMLLLAAINLLFLGLDTYLAHIINGTIREREWIPIVFGVVAGILLLIAGLIALRARRAATIITTVVLLGSIVVGILGAYFHVVRGAYPTAPAGQRVTVELMVWAPPIVAPLMFTIVGLWGISAAWIESPIDSGALQITPSRQLRLPLSKTRAYLLMISLAMLATLISSVLDHARSNFEDPWLWVPLIIGVFGTVVPFGLALISSPTRMDMLAYVIAMLLLMFVGLLGFFLHIRTDLTAGGEFVFERFLRGAPFLAPLLFANMGLIGLVAILDPAERT